MRLLYGNALFEHVLPLLDAYTKEKKNTMNVKTRNLTLGALFSALAVVLLYIASVWPTGQLGLTAVASLFVAAAIIESGLSFGIYVYVVSSIIAFLLVPNRMTAFLFILFFGYYPILKSLIERKGHLVIQILLKLAVFNLSLTLIWILFHELFLGLIPFDLYPVFIYLIGNVVFLLYDYGFSKLVWLYDTEIAIKNRK